MLVLTRRVGESLVLGDGDIQVTLLSIQRNGVRLGIHAPPGMRVDREEVRKQIEATLKAPPRKER